MKQLLLNLDINRPQTFASFIAGQHAELLTLLHRFDQRQPGMLGERAVYIWGDSGVGKSHLLHALAENSGARLLDCHSALTAFDYDATVQLILLDDCQALDQTRQIAAFNLYNQAKEHGALFVATGNQPPATLPLRDDLRTRLGWGLIYQLTGLSDQEKIAALERAAATRGVTLPAGVLPYLITHFRRDMPSLSGLLDAMINLSLEIKRPITLPFVREVMQQQVLRQRSPHE